MGGATRRICFEYFNTRMQRWYRHPGLSIRKNGSSKIIGCKTWQNPSDSNTMFINIVTDIGKHHVYFFDDRSNCKKWTYDFEKTQELANFNAQGRVGLVMSCQPHV